MRYACKYLSVSVSLLLSWLGWRCFYKQRERERKKNDENEVFLSLPPFSFFVVARRRSSPVGVFGVRYVTSAWWFFSFVERNCLGF